MLNSLEEMKAVPIYEIKNFQIFIFMFNCKSETALLIFQNLFIVKSRCKYAIKTTNVLLEPLCRRKFSEFKIYFVGPNSWNN